MRNVQTDLFIEHGVSKQEAISLVNQINTWLSTLSPEKCWEQIISSSSISDRPFKLHQLLYNLVYQKYSSKNPGAAWFPSKNQIEQSNLHAAMRALGFSDYLSFHGWSATHFEEYWSFIIKKLNLHFDRPYHRICDLSEGYESPKWLPGASLNIAENCFNFSKKHTAVIYLDSHKKIKTATLEELHQLSNRIANGLMKQGFSKGDKIGIAMPMTFEAVAIYLSIILAGCCVVSIAESYSAEEISARLEIAEPKAIFTQDFLMRQSKKIPLYEKVKHAYSGLNIVLPYSTQLEVQLDQKDLPWDLFLSENDQFTAIPCAPDMPMNILFSSGTTGTPKAIPWDHTTPLKCAADAYLHHNVQQGDRLLWPTSLGWMMGPWVLYAALLNKATLALYTDIPTSRAFGEFVEHAEITLLGVVPSIVNQWRATQCMQGLDWKKIKVFSSTGETSNPEDMLYLMFLAKYRPIIEYCGGTEIGGAYMTSTILQPNIPSTFSTPAAGLNVFLMDEHGKLTTNGEVAIIPPSIGLSTTLLNKDHHQEYFHGMPKGLDGRPLRRHGDHMERLGNGYYRALGRVDDTMKLGGIKVSAAEIERVVSELSEISECAAIAIEPKEGGPSQLIIFIVPAIKEIDKQQLKKEIQDQIKKKLNPLFKVHDIQLLEQLPRTASNKIMRKSLRALGLSPNV